MLLLFYFLLKKKKWTLQILTSFVRSEKLNHKNPDVKKMFYLVLFVCRFHIYKRKLYNFITLYREIFKTHFLCLFCYNKLLYATKQLQSYDNCVLNEILLLHIKLILNQKHKFFVSSIFTYIHLFPLEKGFFRSNLFC